MRVDIQNKTYFKKALNTILPDLKLSEFSGITIDSRNIKPGDIFLAFKGESTDGHKYIDHAEKAGASLAIVENNIEIVKDFSVSHFNLCKEHFKLETDFFQVYFDNDEFNINLMRELFNYK